MNMEMVHPVHRDCVFSFCFSHVFSTGYQVPLSYIIETTLVMGMYCFQCCLSMVTQQLVIVCWWDITFVVTLFSWDIPFVVTQFCSKRSMHSILVGIICQSFCYPLGEHRRNQCSPSSLGTESVPITSIVFPPTSDTKSSGGVSKNLDPPKYPRQKKEK